MGFLDALATTFRTMVTDPSAFSAIVASVVIYSFFYPTAYKHELITQVPLAIVDNDGTALSRKLKRVAQAMQGIQIAAEPGSINEAKSLLASGEVAAILWIGPHFERDVLRGNQGEVALLANGSIFLRSRTALTALSAAVTEIGTVSARVQSVAEGSPARPTVTLIQRPLFNTREGYGSAIVPAVVGLIAQQSLLLGIGIMVAGRRLSTLGRGLRAFLGTVTAFAAVGCTSLLYFSGTTLWLQDYPRDGGVSALLALTPVFAAAIATLGLMLASFFDRPERAAQVLLPMTLLFFFLAGFSWPPSSMPEPLASLARLIPSTSGIPALIKVNQMDASVGDITPELITLAALALVFGTIAWFRLSGPVGRPRRASRGFISN